MASFVVLARVALAAVFVTAGVAKLLDRPGSRSALAGFGVPDRWIRPVAWLLPLAEIATALALLFVPTAQWGALAALVLLLAFIAGISYAMSRGRAPDCHCFGQLHSEPAGPSTLIRNAVLAVVAAIAVWKGPGPAINEWVADRTAVELVAIGLGAAAILLAASLLRLWSENRGLKGELEATKEELALFPAGLPVGAEAPSFALPGMHGETVTLESLCARGSPVLLVFAAPKCGPCWLMLPNLSRWQRILADRLTLIFVSTGTPEDNQEIVDDYGVVDLLMQEGTEVADRYRVDATPTAVVVTPDGRVASTTVVGSNTIEPLIRLTLQGVSPIGTSPSSAATIGS